MKALLIFTTVSVAYFEIYKGTLNQVASGGLQVGTYAQITPWVVGSKKAMNQLAPKLIWALFGKKFRFQKYKQSITKNIF